MGEFYKTIKEKKKEIFNMIFFPKKMKVPAQLVL